MDEQPTCTICGAPATHIDSECGNMCSDCREVFEEMMGG